MSAGATRGSTQPIIIVFIDGMISGLRRKQLSASYLNPATLVTPTFQGPVLIYPMTKNQHLSRNAQDLEAETTNFELS